MRLWQTWKHAYEETELASSRQPVEDRTMNIRGRVKDGVVVFEDGPVLPEGSVVTVSCPDEVHPPSNGQTRRVQLPLVASDRPGSVSLTAERVAELLGEADVSG